MSDKLSAIQRHKNMVEGRSMMAAEESPIYNTDRK